MTTIKEASQLLQLLDITYRAVHTIIAEWAKLPSSSSDSRQLPNRELFEAQRTVIAVSGKLVELVASPSERLLEVSSQYNEARCLHIAASLRIPTILAKADEQCLFIEKLSANVGIEWHKLCMASVSPLSA